MEQETLFFSIITPTYNRAYILEKLFNSLNIQTYKNFEWVVGDDGSTDNTEELIASFKEKASFNIRYIKLEHKGKAKAYEVILNSSKGEYILSVDSDDALYSEKTLENMFQNINSLEPDKNFWGACGCYVDQYNVTFPDMDIPFIDITKENFFDMWANGSKYLNCKWIHKNGLFKAYNHDDIKEFLPYYPEIVDFMRNVIESKDFYYRLFNEPIIDYIRSGEDCVSLIKPNLMYWYETIGIINLFFKHNLHKKYFKIINKKISLLANTLYKEKDFLMTLKALQDMRSQLIFIFYYFIGNKISLILKNIFAVYNREKHKVFLYFRNKN